MIRQVGYLLQTANFQSGMGLQMALILDRLFLTKSLELEIARAGAVRPKHDEDAIYDFDLRTESHSNMLILFNVATK